MDNRRHTPLEKPDAGTILGLRIYGYGAAVAIIAAFAVGYFYL